MDSQKPVTFKNKKVIVFDLDGTIVRLAADWHSLKKVLTDMYTHHYQENCTFKSMSACLRKIVERGDEEELLNYFDIIRKYELENITQNEPIDETIYFINNKEQFGVKKDIKFAIFSLNTRQTIIESLKRAKIIEKIDLIIGREDVRKWKPEPEGLIKIKKFFNVNAKEMIFFGDLDKDILTGLNAGIDVYYIDEIINLVKRKIS